MTIKYNEYGECLTFYQWTQWQPRLKDRVIKIANEGKRSIIGGKRLKRIGLTKGIPDYFIFIPTFKYHGLFIEMKIKDSGKIDKNQEAWIEKLTSYGYCAKVAYGAADAIRIIESYLNER